MPEYLSSSVNALTNSLKISYQNEGDFFQFRNTVIYLELARKEGNSGVLISAVFGTR